jgi:hypothetical protein
VPQVRRDGCDRGHAVPAKTGSAWPWARCGSGPVHAPPLCGAPTRRLSRPRRPSAHLSFSPPSSVPSLLHTFFRGPCSRPLCLRLLHQAPPSRPHHLLHRRPPIDVDPQLRVPSTATCRHEGYRHRRRACRPKPARPSPAGRPRLRPRAASLRQARGGQRQRPQSERRWSGRRHRRVRLRPVHMQAPLMSLCTCRSCRFSFRSTDHVRLRSQTCRPAPTLRVGLRRSVTTPLRDCCARGRC